MEDGESSSRRATGLWRTFAALLLIAFLATTSLATAQSPAAATPVSAPSCGATRSLGSYLCVAYAQDPTAPCAGHVNVIFTEALVSHDATAEATGIVQWGDQEHPAPDGQPDELQSCDISIRPSAWQHLSSPQRCVVVAHEVEHLAGHRHYEGSAMNGRPFVPCDVFAPLADRAITRLAHLKGATNVGCSNGSSIVRCDVEFGHRSREYRVRVRAHIATLLVSRISQ